MSEAIEQVVLAHYPAATQTPSEAPILCWCEGRFDAKGYARHIAEELREQVQAEVMAGVREDIAEARAVFGSPLSAAGPLDAVSYIEALLVMRDRRARASARDANKIEGES